MQKSFPFWLVILILCQNFMFLTLGIFIGGHKMATTYATSANTDGKSTATFTFGDTEFNDVNNGTCTLTDYLGQSVTLTIKNDYGASSAGEFNAGGSAAACAANFIAEVNRTGGDGFGDSGGIVATNPSGGVIVLTAGIPTPSANTTIVFAASFESSLESGYSTAFTGGAAGNENGATVLHGGNVDSSKTVTNSKTLRGNLDASAVYGSKVTAITGTKHKPGVQTSKGSGALAYQPAASDPQFLMRGYSSKINNVASTALQIAGADAAGRGDRGGVVKTHKYNITSIAYNTGFATKGGTAGDVSNFVKSDGSTAASDEALETSRSVPGELVFHIGAKVPTQADYSTKTGG